MTASPAAFLVTWLPSDRVTVAPSGTTMPPASSDRASSNMVTSSLPTMRPPPVTA